MRALLDTLSDKAKNIVILRVFNGLSAEETAEIVGSTPGAVRVAQHRALAQLRKTLQAAQETARWGLAADSYSRYLLTERKGRDTIMAPKHHGDNDGLADQLQPLVDDDAFLTELSKGNALPTVRMTWRSCCWS